MAGRGVVPKRSAERRRTNSAPVEKVVVAGTVEVPLLPDGLHELAVEWYASLRESAQSRYYEPSDWHTARAVAIAWSSFFRGGATSSTLLTAIRQMQEPLLVTEGTRRRAHLEVERPDVADEPKPVNVTDYRARMSQGGRRGR